MAAVTVIYTLAQYTALSDAIAQGAKEVQYSDKKVVYRDLDEMLRILALMRAQLFPNLTNNNARTYPSFTRGTVRRRRC